VYQRPVGTRARSERPGDDVSFKHATDSRADYGHAASSNSRSTPPILMPLTAIIRPVPSERLICQKNYFIF
jgi:hypothetical protein